MEKLIKTILTDKNGKEFTLENNHQLTEEMKQSAIEARDGLSAKVKAEEDLAGNVGFNKANQ